MSTEIAPLPTGSALAPVIPRSIEDVYRLAKMALVSGMLKPSKSGYGEHAVTEEPEATLARGTMIIMQGLELGLPPMQSIQLLAMINGRIVAHSEAVPGILLSKGFLIKQRWSGTALADDWTAHCELTRPDGSTLERSFSVGDAKQAGLWDRSPMVTKFGKTKPNDSAWYRYPQRMLWARALGFAGKDGGADALRGMMVREEAEDIQRHREAANLAVDVTASHSLPPPPPPSAPPVLPDEPETDPRQIAYLDRLKDEIGECGHIKALVGVWTKHTPQIDRLDKALKIDAMASYAAAENRIESAAKTNRKPPARPPAPSRELR